MRVWLLTLSTCRNKQQSPDPDVNTGTESQSGANPKSRIVNPKDGSVMQLIPGGACIIGSTMEQVAVAAAMDVFGHPDLLVCETPQFTAVLPNYYMCVYSVTNAQFALFLNETQPSPEELRRFGANLEYITATRTGLAGIHYKVRQGFERHPVIHVTWFGAEAYCHWAGLRLPTELEWEKAARGTDGRIFPWGNQWRPDALRWHGGDRHATETTAPVDAYPQGRSPYGIFQMSGNVDEWCADWYQWDVYQRYATGDLRPPVNGDQRVVRGGTCLRWQRHHFRCAMRRGNDPAWVNIHYTGFRCAADAPQSDPTLSVARQDNTEARTECVTWSQC